MLTFEQKLKKLQIQEKSYGIQQITSKTLDSLVDNDYLNEDRYAKMFIQGKLRIKKWGRIKLKYELRLKGLDINIIDDNINKIKDEEYIRYFNEFSTNKIKFLKGTKDQKKRSFINYFTYRGWENSLIYQKLNEIN